MTEIIISKNIKRGIVKGNDREYSLRPNPIKSKSKNDTLWELMKKIRKKKVK